jgi:hypothetical protein
MGAKTRLGGKGVLVINNARSVLTQRGSAATKAKGKLAAD